MHKQWYSAHEILVAKSEQDDESNYTAPQSTLRPGLVITSDTAEKEDA